MFPVDEIIRLMQESRRLGVAEVRIRLGSREVLIRNYVPAGSRTGTSTAPLPGDGSMVSAPAEIPPAIPETPEAVPRGPQEEGSAPAPAGEVTRQEEISAELTPEEAERRGLYVQKSPIVGTFYRRPSPDKDPFVQEGDVVKKGQVLCLIEAMKIFNEVEAEVDGKILRILVEDGAPVEFGQPLFIIEPAK